jgi:probable F420-dependent oxidoreductase
MDFGVLAWPTDESPDPVELACAAEGEGLATFYLPDHTHVPASRLSPFPNPPYGELPREYYRFRDPFITLGGIATRTSSIRLGTSVCLVVARDPIVLAKQIATLDLMSGGRVVLGVGAGWNREEMANHGTDPRTRMTLLMERVEAMQRIWTDELASYHGDLVHFDDLYAWPKPVQQPLPVLVGGNGPTVLDRVLRVGTGWFPGHQKDLTALGERIVELRERAATASAPRPRVVVVYAREEFLDAYREMDVDECVFALDPAADAAAATRHITKLARSTAAWRT